MDEPPKLIRPSDSYTMSGGQQVVSETLPSVWVRLTIEGLRD